MIKVYLTDHVWLVHTVIDKWGEPMTVTHSPLNGKLVYKTRKVIDFKGEEAISEFSVCWLLQPLTMMIKFRWCRMQLVNLAFIGLLRPSPSQLTGVLGS